MNTHKSSKQSGIAHFGLVVLALLTLVAVGFAAWRVLGSEKQENATNTSGNTQESSKNTTAENVTWQWQGDAWKASSTAPKCKDPVVFGVSPADLSKATGVLYPGQVRGGNYKPHGGFRFDNSKSDDVQVKAVMEGDVVSASRYIESGEVQYLFTIENDCGIAYRYDHLATLSPEFQKIADTLPQPKKDDSRGTNFDKPYRVKEGDVVATAVGFKNGKNIGFDFGVYDYRQKNDASKNSSYAQKYKEYSSQTFYAVCWFDMLPGKDSELVKSLPAADQQQGKTSDYCK